jgi:hypothetical protein
MAQRVIVAAPAFNPSIRRSCAVRYSFPEEMLPSRRYPNGPTVSDVIADGFRNHRITISHSTSLTFVAVVRSAVIAAWMSPSRSMMIVSASSSLVSSTRARFSGMSFS